MLHQIPLVALVCFRCPRPSPVSIFSQNLKKPIQIFDLGQQIDKITSKSDKEGFQEMLWKLGYFRLNSGQHQQSWIRNIFTEKTSKTLSLVPALLKGMCIYIYLMGLEDYGTVFVTYLRKVFVFYVFRLTFCLRTGVRFFPFSTVWQQCGAGLLAPYHHNLTLCPVPPVTPKTSPRLTGMCFLRFTIVFDTLFVMSTGPDRAWGGQHALPILSSPQPALANLRPWSTVFQNSPQRCVCVLGTTENKNKR